jgi:hypothetical protein
VAGSVVLPKVAASGSVSLIGLSTAVTLRRVDALLTLHWLLRFWIPMHIAATSIMLVLMLVHIGQVVFFRVN